MKNGNYRLDPSQSQVAFEVSNFKFFKVQGEFKEFSAQLTLHEDSSQNSLYAEVRSGSIHSNWGTRDEHLKKDDFLNVATYPSVVFRASGFPAPKNRFSLKGDLSFLGVTKPVQISGELTGTQAGHASFAIDRREFGLTGVPSISHEVKIKLTFVFKAL